MRTALRNIVKIVKRILEYIIWVIETLVVSIINIINKFVTNIIKIIASTVLLISIVVALVICYIVLVCFNGISSGTGLFIWYIISSLCGLILIYFIIKTIKTYKN